jgi:hypothetical protein
MLPEGSRKTAGTGLLMREDPIVAELEEIRAEILAECEFPKICHRSSLNSGAIQDH